MDLVVNGKVYMVGNLYRVLTGEDTNRCLSLDRIVFDEDQKAYFLEVGDNSFNSNYAADLIEEEDTQDYVHCTECGSWIYKR